MCDSGDHNHHDHGNEKLVDNDPRFTDDDDYDHIAVDHPVTREYMDERIFVRELATNFYDYRDVWEELRDPDNRVIKGSEIPLSASLGPGTHNWGKSYVRPWTGVGQALSVHINVLAPEGHNRKHGHQNEALMYILEGEGYELHDGEEYKWEAGDMAVIHGGCVHQHYSVDPENPCKALIIKPKPLYQFLHLLYQGHVEPDATVPAKYPDWTPPEDEWNTEQRHGKDGM